MEVQDTITEGKCGDLLRNQSLTSVDTKKGPQFVVRPRRRIKGTESSTEVVTTGVRQVVEPVVEVSEGEWCDRGLAEDCVRKMEDL